MLYKHMFVYIMANKNKNNPVLYTGVTNNLIRRVQEHKTGIIKGFTQKYHLHNLLYYEMIEGPEQAIIREKQIKNMARDKKLQTIKAFNPACKDLYYQLAKTIF